MTFIIVKTRGDYSLTRRQSSWEPGERETWTDPMRAMSRFMQLVNEDKCPVMYSDIRGKPDFTVLTIPIAFWVALIVNSNAASPMRDKSPEAHTDPSPLSSNETPLS